MNYKRAVGYGLMMWILIFMAMSIIVLLPFLQGKTMTQSIIWWVVEVPLFIFWAKAYFKTVYPSFFNGVRLWVIAFVVGVILDSTITIPLFVKSYSAFFSNWTLYVGYAIGLATTSLAAAEFDATNVKPEQKA